MILPGILCATAIVTFLGIYRWRLGLLLSIPFGIMADAARKVIDGEPVYLSGLIVLPVLASLIGARLARGRIIPVALRRQQAWLKVPLVLYLLLVLLQSLNGIYTSGSPMVGVIGLVAYLIPVVGLVLGAHYARRTRDIQRFLLWYVVLATAMAATVYLARLGISGKIFEPVGSGLVALASPSGVALDLEPGLYRAEEVAAWHTATAICFLLILYFRKRRPWISLVPIACLLAVLGGALLMTGRRKGIVEVGLFVLVYLACLAYFRRGAIKTALVLGLLSAVGMVVFLVSTIGQKLSIHPYFERGLDIGGKDVRRVQTFAVDLLGAVIEQNGWFGSGAGSGSQGAQHFGAGADLVGIAAEGGVGKIVAELGVPGLIFVVWLGLAFAVVFWKAARASSRRTRATSYFAYGCLAFMIPNAMTFTIGHQIFGDPLVLTLTGIMAGMLLSVPYLKGDGRRTSHLRPRSRAGWRNRSRHGSAAIRRFRLAASLRASVTDFY